MIRHETLAEPWPAFICSQSRATCIGHGIVVARRIFDRAHDGGDGQVIYYDVQMPDGTLRTVTPDMVAGADNVALRMITPAPLRIPAAPRARGWM